MSLWWIPGCRSPQPPGSQGGGEIGRFPPPVLNLQPAALEGRVILYSSPPTGQPSQHRFSPLALGRAGFPYLVIRGVDDDPISLRRVLARSAVRRSLLAADCPLLANLGSERLAGLLPLLTRWPEPETSGDLAKEMCVAERTLRRRVKLLAAAPPRDLRCWSRLLEANHLWLLGLDSRAAIAHHLGYAEPSSLSHLCRDFAGVPLGSILAPGGVGIVLSAMVRTCTG